MQQLSRQDLSSIGRVDRIAPHVRPQLDYICSRVKPGSRLSAASSMAAMCWLRQYTRLHVANSGTFLCPAVELSQQLQLLTELGFDIASTVKKVCQGVYLGLHVCHMLGSLRLYLLQVCLAVSQLAVALNHVCGGHFPVHYPSLPSCNLVRRLGLQRLCCWLACKDMRAVIMDSKVKVADTCIQ